MYNVIEYMLLFSILEIYIFERKQGLKPRLENVGI